MARPVLSSSARLVRIPLLLLALTSACDDGGGGGGGSIVPIDGPSDGGVQGMDGSTVVTGPTVIETFPAANAKGVEEDAVLVFHFSEPMDAAATQAAASSDVCNGASASTDFGSRSNIDFC